MTLSARETNNTILMVRDDPRLSATLKQALSIFQFAVQEFSTLAQARQFLETSNLIDLIIVDAVVSDGSGIDLISWLRSRNLKTPVVYIASNFRDLQTLKQLNQEFQVSLVVYPPLDIAEFVQNVVQILRPPETDEDQRLEEALAKMSAEFSQRLPHKIDEIATCLAQVKAGEQPVSGAITLAHRLHGSAGSYGFSEVGRHIGKIEKLLGAPLDWEQIDQTLLDARRALERAQPCQSWARARPGLPHLLVVDDDRDFLALVGAVGKKFSVPILTTTHADEAVALAQQNELLGALLDVHLGLEFSFQLARQLRDLPGKEALPLAFTSVDHSMETRVNAVQAGGSRFFDKPVREESLMLMLQHFEQLSQNRKGRVLVVDDDPDAATAYAEILRGANLSVEVLYEANQLTEMLDRFHPDLLLLDIEMPQISGLDVCQALRASDRWEMMPVLLMSARVDSERRIRGFHCGASDVLVKPILPEELLARVAVQLERQRLVRERSDRDPLSGLLMRRAFTDACQRSLSSAIRNGSNLSLCLIDIDRFKSINDCFGHSAGDRVLAFIGDLLRRRFRQEDLRCRWGGEEFLLAFPGQTAEFAEMAAGKILAELACHMFYSDQGEAFQVTFTGGVAAFPENGQTIQALVGHADKCLYQGKAAGRNQICRSKSRRDGPR